MDGVEKALLHAPYLKMKVLLIYSKRKYKMKQYISWGVGEDAIKVRIFYLQSCVESYLQDNENWYGEKTS